MQMKCPIHDNRCMVEFVDIICDINAAKLCSIRQSLEIIRLSTLSSMVAARIVVLTMKMNMTSLTLGLHCCHNLSQSGRPSKILHV